MWFEYILNYLKLKDFINISKENANLVNLNNNLNLNNVNISNTLSMKKSLLISIVNFPESSFQPNSMHQSTVKRRIYHFLCSTLKINKIIPLDPLIFYNYSNHNLKKIYSKSSHNDTLSLNTNNQIIQNDNLENNLISNINKKQIDNIEAIECEITSNNVTSLKNQSFLFNKKNKTSKEAALKEDFINVVTIVLNNLSNYNKEVDISDI